MEDFGVCSNNSDERCGLSFKSPLLDELPERTKAIKRIRISGGNADAAISEMKRFVSFFQEGVSCQHCNSPLVSNMLSTAGLVAGSEEYNRRARLNRILEARHELRAMRVLPGGWL